jgi:hypothetical protein
MKSHCPLLSGKLADQGQCLGLEPVYKFILPTTHRHADARLADLIARPATAAEPFRWAFTCL